MGFDKPIKNSKIFDLHKNGPSFPTDQQELPSDPVSMLILLSSERFIPIVKRSLYPGCKYLDEIQFEDDGRELTISGYQKQVPFDAEGVLRLVQTLDPGAVRAQ